MYISPIITLKRTFPFILLLATITSSLAQELSEFYPSISGELIEHNYYSLDYNENTEQPNWVIYAINPIGKTDRSDNFKIDPLVSTRSASLSDYKGSGFDRGHLAPAGDMNVSSTAMSESFYMSNMSPQKPGFNRGIWKKLEALMRSWSYEYSSENDYVVVGPVINGNNCGSIGSGVAVPCYYYRIYLNLDRKQAIGFILPHESSRASLKSYAVSIDSIEHITSIDFFINLEDKLEESLESNINTNEWIWNASNSTFSQKKYSGKATTVQCHGIAKSTGVRCKLKTKNENMTNPT